MTTTKTKPTPRRTTRAIDDAMDDLAALLTAVHNEKHHPGKACRMDGQGRCDAITRSRG